MTVYCISYDLIGDKDYDKLFEKIKSYEVYAHAQESLWFIKSSKDAAVVREELSPFVDDDDKILVIKVTLPWASRNLDKDVTDWLKGMNL